MVYFKVASITDTKFHLPFFERIWLIFKKDAPGIVKLWEPLGSAEGSPKRN
jgi:hypothetical protein